jgi:rhamnosyltransferase
MPNTNNTKLSVIIPTLNGEATLPDFFAALLMQDIEVDEIIVGDSESSDRTVEICTAHGAEIVTIPRNEFDHGGTRTVLGERAKGDIVVYFTQDAVLSSPSSLRKLISALIENDTVSCAYGRQLPLPEASLLAGHLRYFNYPATSETRIFADRINLGLKTIFISNSLAAYRRTDLAAVGFFKNGLIFGEDTCTLGLLLLKGGSVCYVGDAAVYHSHNYEFTEEFRRSFDIGVLHSSEKWLLETFGNAEGIGRKYVRSALNEILLQKQYIVILDWFLRSCVKFTGYKLGRLYKHLPQHICSKLSLNRRWWDRNGKPSMNSNNELTS